MNYSTPNELFVTIYNFLSLLCISAGAICFMIATLFLLEPIRKKTGSKALSLSAVFSIWAIMFYLFDRGIL